MIILLRLSDLLAIPCQLAAKLCGWLLLVLAAVILYDVVGRRFFSTGSFKLQELEWHIHGTIAVLCFGWTYLANAHVRIDVFSTNMQQNTRLWLEIAAIVAFLIPFMLLLIWFGYDFVLRSFLRGESSPGGVGLSHRWIIKSMIPLGALLTISGGLAVLFRAIVALRRPDILHSPWER
ncbi:TRAP transporter small permease subunit [Roseibium sp. CAU 1637]|uniref:TRAP transporter small permease protein n=1 Tax=Roseibium limicola TaxID=2816037 RepID=A0A939ESE7_9HYPH|nr:TRAP transporter small permease subunit [Roseibium limicola]MBO0347460.1 TRAP transporter small permease subunit [Roseibium limicola]